MTPIHIRFGGYQPPASVMSRAAAVLGQALAARLGEAVRFDLEGDVVISGRPAADLLALVERGDLTMCYFSTSYLARRVPECCHFEIYRYHRYLTLSAAHGGGRRPGGAREAAETEVVRLTEAERVAFTDAVAPVAADWREGLGARLVDYLG